jgi:hypothetical protein
MPADGGYPAMPLLWSMNVCRSGVMRRITRSVLMLSGG